MALAFLFSLLLILSPTQLGKHWWPQWSLVSGVRVDYLSPTLFLTDIFLLLLCFFILRGGRHARSSLITVLSSLPFLLSTFYFLMLSFLSPRPFLSLYSLARYAQIPLVAWVTRSVARRMSKPHFRTLVVSSFSVASVAVVALELIQMTSGTSTGLLWVLGERSFTINTPGISTMWVFGHEILRPYATFSHPNALAGWLLVTLLLLRSLSVKRATPSLLDHVVQSCCVVGIFLSGSRLALGSLLLIILIPRVLRPGFHTILSGFIPLISFAPNSLNERVTLAQASIQMVLDHPVFGVGPGHFFAQLPSYLPRTMWLLQPVHSVPLLILSEFGLVVVVVAGICTWKFLTSSLKSSLMFSPLVAIFLTGLGDHYWITAQQNRILLGVIFGLLAWGGWGGRLRRFRSDD